MPQARLTASLQSRYDWFGFMLVPSESAKRNTSEPSLCCVAGFQEFIVPKKAAFVLENMRLKIEISLADMTAGFKI
ncbi:hypothetical protein [Planktotalea sp.]|uniref:hypothetical protein n=1 Tax=Planktotalea sp. TaxID=2029877 RepID=UPI003299FC07